MERKTIEQLEKLGFQKVLEKGSLIYMAKKTNDGDTLAHFIVNKETGLALNDFAYTISFENIAILNEMVKNLK